MLFDFHISIGGFEFKAITQNENSECDQSPENEADGFDFSRLGSMDLANKECQSKCKEDEDCSFYAVNEANKYCTLFKTCHESDREVPRNRYSIFQKIEIGKRSPTEKRVDMSF